MFRFAKLLSAVCLASAVMVPSVGSAKQAKVIATIPVTDEFIESKLRWTNSAKPGFILRWKTKRIDGKIAICGIVHYPDVQLRPPSRNVLRQTRITLNDKTILSNMLFFNRVVWAKDMDTAEANCAYTNAKAPKGSYSVYLNWGGGRAKF